jgi:hypothetical protein
VAADQSPESLPWQPPRRPIPARHSSVWVRVSGRWLRGAIQHWELREGRWIVWMQHEDPDGSPWAVWSHYLYAPETIRPRHGHEPPVED